MADSEHIFTSKELPVKPSTLLRSRLAVGVVASALLITGCSSSTDGKKDTPKGDGDKLTLASGLLNMGEPGKAVKGGTLTIGEYAETRSMNPTLSYANGAAGGSALAAVYDTLVRYDWTDHSWEPQLAESLSVDDAGTLWTLKLRKDVKFTDGTPLNADAVVASIENYSKNYGYNFGIWTAGVKETKKVDDLTVTFATNYPWKTLPGMLAQGPGMILAPAAYKDPAKFEPIGAGPFVFKSYAPAESLEVVANEDYFNGRPNLDGIKFVWPGADSAKVEALDNGDVDAVFLRDTKIVAAGVEAKKPGMLWTTGAGVTFLINHREGNPGANPTVRQALNLALDPVRYFERIDNPAAVPNKQLMPKNSPWFTAVDVAEPNVEEAKKLVEQAKTEGWDGEIEYSHLADPISQKAAVTVKALLETAGFKVKLDPQANIADQTTKVFVENTFELAIGAVSVGEEDPYAGLAGPLQPESTSNASGYKSADMGAALTELAAASGPEDGKAAMTKIEELWQKDLPGINMADGGFMLRLDGTVHGIQPTTQMMTLYDKAWISK